MNPLTFSQHRDAIASGSYLRVVNYHNTPRAGRGVLRAELADWARRYDCVTFDELDGFFRTGVWPSERPGFVPVFYEGYRNSYDVAGQVCDELGLTAWFPVCTGFVDCPVEEQELYARSHYIGLVEEDLAGDRIAMSWDEVGELSRRHLVTPHTASHAGIADVSTDEDLEREVFEPKRRMDAVTGQSAPAFAWLGGSPYGLSERHDHAVRDAGYRYLISNTMVQRINA